MAPRTRLEAACQRSRVCNGGTQAKRSVRWRGTPISSVIALTRSAAADAAGDACEHLRRRRDERAQTRCRTRGSLAGRPAKKEGGCRPFWRGGGAALELRLRCLVTFEQRGPQPAAFCWASTLACPQRLACGQASVDRDEEDRRFVRAVSPCCSVACRGSGGNRAPPERWRRSS